MIFVRDKGRMCNNLLQYAHVYAWGREHGRSTMSMRFAYKYPYFNIGHTKYHNFCTYVFAKYVASLGLLPVVSFNEEQADTAAQEQQMLSRRNLIVEGWYARWYDLFLKYKPDILQLFRFNDNIEQHVADLLSPLTANSSPILLGVHVRRGDYATWQKGRYYYTDQQYISLIRQFIGLHPDRQVHVFVCSNDPSLDRQCYYDELNGDVSFPNGTAGDDLCLLSHCHYLMGPPSTFTLVAAMYHDARLCWVTDAQAPLTTNDFKPFEQLFRNII